MKNAFESLLGQHRLVLLAALVLSIIGGIAWTAMPRQEDPELTGRWATVSVSFPGADAEAVPRGGGGRRPPRRPPGGNLGAGGGGGGGGGR